MSRIRDGHVCYSFRHRRVLITARSRSLAESRQAAGGLAAVCALAILLGLSPAAAEDKPGDQAKPPVSVPTDLDAKWPEPPTSPWYMPLDDYYNYVKYQQTLDALLKKQCIDADEKKRVLTATKEEIVWLLRYAKSAKTPAAAQEANEYADILNASYVRLEKMKECPPPTPSLTPATDDFIIPGQESEPGTPEEKKKKELEKEQEVTLSKINDYKEAQSFFDSGQTINDWMKQKRYAGVTPEDYGRYLDRFIKLHQRLIDNPELLKQLDKKLDELDQAIQGLNKSDSAGSGSMGSAGGVNYTPGATWTVTIAMDGVEWCTFGPGRGIAAVLTPIDAKANLIASVAPAEAAATAKTTPSATDRPPSTPRTLQAAAEQPKQIAPPPMASLLPRARPAPTTPITDNPAGAGTPDRPNTAERTPPATSTTPSATLDPRSPPASDRPAPAPPISNRPPGNTPSARTPEQPQMTDRTPPPSDNPAPPTADLVPTPVTVTIDINEKATPEVVAKNVEEAKPKAEPSAAVKLKWITPDLPGSGEKTAHDEGSEKNPAAGRVGEPITTDEPQTYRLASGPGAPTHYRAEIDTPEHSGFVAETTGKPVKAAALASAVPAGVKAMIDTVRFGGQTHTRLGLDWPRSQQVDPTALAALISRAIGAKLGIDACRRTKPAPALSLEPATPSAIASALPATIIKLRRTIEVGRAR